MPSSIQDHDSRLTVTAGGAVAVGSVQKVGSVVGIAETAAAASGDHYTLFKRGTVTGVTAETGVAWSQGDVIYWDAGNSRFTKNPSGNTRCGIAALAKESATATATIQLTPMAQGLVLTGVKTLAATGAQSLTAADLGKLILMPNTAALTLTLPAAAECAGGIMMFKKTSADAFAVTIDGKDSETIDGSANFASCDAANDTITIVCDGTAWYIVAKAIA